ncbi:ABC transporter ATP-binding protein [Kaistella yonginensis]|uniref:ABC transporter ATP-binding protein n=1 Tax=Kaistella yonginensis TaxID=658267 RepID=UPI0025B54402|nr:ABC transporter ATP-binding protein [Kaistella yonginensis]MDN3605672.1 ABC transporter ATP-binding protein [Kaistella yonginensis]
MNPNTAIRAENISKQYRLGEVGTGTLTHDLNRAWAKLRGKEDPFLKIGDSNDRSTKGESDYVWSLKDINFEIEKGDAVGIIGRNGAGKSTLLKLLSRVTKPTTGHFEVQGRIASLLEVGTGFNPEMTGRENIFLNGAILGMRRQEIKRKFDEIVDFAGVERYIDTPVKRYSSGMYVRLAFAVAAHLESEILIVDEVLAVGDAEFQKKCLGKMGDVSKGEGRTVLFVSHNMASVRNLCSSGIYLKYGKIELKSNIENIVESYLNDNDFDETIQLQFIQKNKDKILDYIEVRSLNDSSLISGESLIFNLRLKKVLGKIDIHIGVYDRNDEKILNLSTEYFPDFKTDKNSFNCVLKKNPLPEGNYYAHVFFKNLFYEEFNSHCLKFTVLNGDFYNQGRITEKIPSKILVEHEWK